MKHRLALLALFFGISACQSDNPYRLRRRKRKTPWT